MEANTPDKPVPCGMCLQYINDFAENPKVEIVMAKVKNDKLLFETVSEDPGGVAAASLQEIAAFSFEERS